jgi:hypothetical protein
LEILFSVFSQGRLLFFNQERPDMCATRVFAAVIFCYNFSVKLFSDNSPRVYCLDHLEVIFRYEISCMKN